MKQLSLGTLMLRLARLGGTRNPAPGGLTAGL